jgi:hypothetical protein
MASAVPKKPQKQPGLQPLQKPNPEQLYGRLIKLSLLPIQ